MCVGKEGVWYNETCDEVVVEENLKALVAILTVVSFVNTIIKGGIGKSVENSK